MKYCVPPGVLPTQSVYSCTFAPALHVNATLLPERVLPGDGLVMIGVFDGGVGDGLDVGEAVGAGVTDGIGVGVGVAPDAAVYMKSRNCQAPLTFHHRRT
jgi:hypothetical protein